MWSKAKVILRTATLEDLEVLHLWDRDPHVGYSGGDTYDWEYELGRLVSWREILIAEVDGRPIGVTVLIDTCEEETHYWGAHSEQGAWAIDIWIGSPENRSKGYGREMMLQSLHRCFAIHKAHKVLIDPLESNLRAISFYERLGFRVLGPVIFDDDECLVMAIDKEEFLR
ncbi:MAG: acetyltransferase [Actinobacteria bacterium]|nr:acetyltransferase [Actinomycetota bacterium]